VIQKETCIYLLSCVENYSMLSLLMQDLIFLNKIVLILYYKSLQKKRRELLIIDTMKARNYKAVIVSAVTIERKIK
jgi:hypothetical protein